MGISEAWEGLFWELESGRIGRRKYYFVYLYYNIPSSNICYWRLWDSPQGWKDLCSDPMPGPRTRGGCAGTVGIPSGVATHSQSHHWTWADIQTRLLFLVKCPMALSDTFSHSFLFKTCDESRGSKRTAVFLGSCETCTLMDINLLGSVTGCARGWRESKGGREDGCCSYVCPFCKHNSCW